MFSIDKIDEALRPIGTGILGRDHGENGAGVLFSGCFIVAAEPLSRLWVSVSGE
jgi:hypothetical protein